MIIAQWTGKNWNELTLNEWFTNLKHGANPLGEDLMFSRMIYRPYDWIVIDNDGRVSKITDAAMKELNP